MTATGAALRAIERVDRLCAEACIDDRCVDTVSFRLAVLDEIRRVVAFDAFAWLLTDPETEVGSAPVADVPCLPELPRLIRLKYLTPVNRWTHLDGAVSLLSASTGGRLERSLAWSELLSEYDVTDVASLVFRCRYGCWGFLDLWRCGSSDAFTPSDAAFLAAIAKPVTQALRRCVATTFGLAAPAMVRVGPVMLLLSPDLDVRAETPETNGYLRVLVPAGADQRPIPAGAYNVGAQLLASEAGVDRHPPTARVHLSAGVWLTLRAARIGGAGPTVGQDIAVAIDIASPAERLSLFGRACGLSARELELLGHLIRGSDTRHIAAKMFLAENTVQDHLKSIFSKTGTRNRRLLLARAAGH
jgi:DNA-binding NarL/FixJ family response regulator